MKPPVGLRAVASVMVIACGVLSLSELALGSEGGAEDGARARIVRTRRIAPGLLFTRIVQKNIPRRTFVLKMDPSRDVTLDITLAEAAMPARAPLSRIVAAHDALAGVNGDYSGNGDPFHALAQDGHLLQTSERVSFQFALSADESRSFFDVVAPRIHLSNTDSGATFRIRTWNDGPVTLGELAGYSPLGGTLEPPPPYACSARLMPRGRPTLAPEDGVNRDFVVDEVGCSAVPMPRNGGVIVATPPATDEATQLLALTPGTRMRLHWTYGWPGVMDSVGGFPLLIRDGTLVGMCRHDCGIQPRTAVGVTRTGEVLLVVVDGRQRGWSRGVSVIEFARLMRDLGAVTALNLDGGGSSEMVVEGEVVNRPSDGRERHISNAILVLPGPDPGEG